MYEDILMNAAVRVYEGLQKQVSESNVTVEELNNKIDKIMDALGLQEDDTVEDKTEDVITEEETTEDTTEE